MPRLFFRVLSVGLVFFPALGWAQVNACDLNSDGAVNSADEQAAVNMVLGLLPCTANIYGAGVCNVVVVQRVVNAALGGPCLTGTSVIPHSVSLNWTSSTSPNVQGYNIYSGTKSGGPYTTINSSIVTGTTYTDTNVQAGLTYYYVTTAVDTSNNQSTYSNEAQAIVPSP